MSKQSNKIALLSASLILGFTQVSFAEEPDSQGLLNIPPPPVLRGPPGDNGQVANVGTGRSLASMVSAAPTTAAPVSTEVSKNPFARNNTPDNGAATQSANAAAVNAATQEALRKAQQASAVPSAVWWGPQAIPTANTMYSNPQRRQ